MKRCLWSVLDAGSSVKHGSETFLSGYVQVSPNDEDVLEDASNRTSDSFLMPLFIDINAELDRTIFF